MMRTAVTALGLIAATVITAPATAQFLPGYAATGSRGLAIDPDVKLDRLADASTPNDEDRSRPKRGRRGDILKNDPNLRAAFGLSSPR